MYDDEDHEGQSEIGGVSVGDRLLVITVDGVNEAGVLLGSSMVGIHLATTHRMEHKRDEVTDEARAELREILDGMPRWEAWRLAREFGVRHPWFKSSRDLWAICLNGAIRQTEDASERDVLVPLLMPVIVVIPLKRIRKVIMFDQWQEELSLRGLDFDGVADDGSDGLDPDPEVLQKA